MNLRGMRTKEPAEGKLAQTILYIRTVVTLLKRRPIGEKRCVAGDRGGGIWTAPDSRRASGCESGSPSSSVVTVASTAMPASGSNPARTPTPGRNTSTATREPDGVLLLQLASDHYHQAFWFSATLNLLISLAARPPVLVSVSLTAPDNELMRMRAPCVTAPAAAARAISADAPTQAELFT